MANFPDFPAPWAESLRSSRSFPLRPCSSIPWHLKQCCAKIGRTSRLKSTANTAVALDRTNKRVSFKDMPFIETFYEGNFSRPLRTQSDNLSATLGFQCGGEDLLSPHCLIRCGAAKTSV
jgi:hypothetical protein